jgi:hypothetical protein
MIVEWADTSYVYDPRLIDVRTAIKIQEYTGLGLRSWERGVDDANPKCMQALLFAVLTQAGERPATIGSLNFSPLDFFDAIVTASTKELAEKLDVAKQAEDAGQVC